MTSELANPEEDREEGEQDGQLGQSAAVLDLGLKGRELGEEREEGDHEEKGEHG